MQIVWGLADHRDHGLFLTIRLQKNAPHVCVFYHTVRNPEVLYLYGQFSI